MLEVKKLKGQASIQDLGRWQTQHLGFSVSGASDEYAFLVGNKLLNNPSNAAAIEVTLGQLSIVTTSTCQIALTGADCKATINGVEVANWAVFTLQPQDELNLLLPKKHLHTYICVKGGIGQHRWLHSYAQTKNEFIPSALDSPITAGSKLTVPTNSSSSEKGLQTKVKKNANYEQFYFSNTSFLRFIPHPYWHRINVKQQAIILNHTFSIDPNSNRMGYTLSKLPEALLKLPQETQRISTPVTFGTIQLPPSRQPIILMKERQTMGGYPTLGSVYQTDLFRFSQCRSGEKVKLVLGSTAQAQQQLQAFYQKLNHSSTPIKNQQYKYFIVNE